MSFKSIPISRANANAPASNRGPGIPYSSPKRKRTYRHDKETVIKTVTQQKRLAELLALQAKNPVKNPNWTGPGGGIATLNAEAGPSQATPASLDDDWEDVVCIPAPTSTPLQVSSPPENLDKEASSDDPVKKKRRRCVPNNADMVLYAKWQELVPTLLDAYLEYSAISTGKEVSVVRNDIDGSCGSRQCKAKRSNLLCLYSHNFVRIGITCCGCTSVAQALIKNGLFPTAPTNQVRVAVSIALLDLHAALFERSFDAVNATAAALYSHYSRRGFYLLDEKSQKYKEPFRRSFGYASQWMDCLRVLVEERVEDALKECDEDLQGKHVNGFRKNVAGADQPRHENDSMDTEDPQNQNSEPERIPKRKPATKVPQELPPLPIPDHCKPGLASSKSEPAESVPLEECARILRQLCPACFGGNTHGKPLLDGGDFHISTDGNFHHRHLVSGGEGIPFHRPKHIIPQSFVDQVGERIEKARKAPPRSRNPKVPDSAVDECEKSHEAADEEKKAIETRYDDKGWMSLICRHDIPLFFASIDTPGEQQKYSVALLAYFFSLIPPKATVTVLYDIGCVLDRSLQIYDILPLSIVDRILFVTTAMHAYGHQWSCQLVYNPRLCMGLGLTDGEGVERTWSRLHKLIPVVRTSSRARRIWLTDRQLTAVALDLRDDLGDWLGRRQKHGINAQQAKAKLELTKCNMSPAELREQWELQKEAQLSVRSHAPARLKKELDVVMSLQSDLDAVEKNIQATKKSLAGGSSHSTSKDVVKDLQAVHQDLVEKVEKLYVSLNITDPDVDLKDVSLEFMRVLLLARDLKINIRKRAIGSFFEWDRLDQAVGGKNQPLGTKLHQHTRKAIAKRKPALLSAIKKFNRYCEKLREMYDPEWNIPLPLPLPVILTELCDDSSLMEDVWITESDTKPQPWLEDTNVRAGIRALLKLERCLEEQRRIGTEADNLCRWFGREMSAVETALRIPAYNAISVQLAQYRDRMLHLKYRWSNHLVLPQRFDSHVEAALKVASEKTGRKEPEVYKWFHYLCEEEDEADFGGAAGEPLSSDPVEPEDELVEVLETTQDNYEEVEDTSGMVYAEDSVALVWELPKLVPDNTLYHFITNTTVAAPVGTPTTKWKFGCYDFEANEMDILGNSRRFLNDTCISGLAVILQSLFSKDPRYSSLANNVAVFNTYALTKVCCKTTDLQLWKFNKLLEYWSKGVWVVPIHRLRQQHWVLAVVYLERREIHLFDSLGGPMRSWKEDLQNIFILISRLVEVSRRFDRPMSTAATGWIAKPIVSAPPQSNGYDCGLWVLACISAVLRGGESLGSNVTEKIMPTWRRLLGGLVGSLSNVVTC